MLEWLTAYGPTTGLVGAVVLLVLTGRLVPRSTSRAQIAAAEKTAELWQKAAEADRARADTAMQQSTQLLSGMQTIEALMRAIAPPKGQ